MEQNKKRKLDLSHLTDQQLNNIRYSVPRIASAIKNVADTEDLYLSIYDLLTQSLIEEADREHAKESSGRVIDFSDLGELHDID